MSNDKRSSDDGPDLSQELEIDQICLRFEDHLKQREQPEIERFLDGEDTSIRSRLLRQLILLEAEYQRRQGRTVDPEQYLLRFPEALPLVGGVGSGSPSTL